MDIPPTPLLSRDALHCLLLPIVTVTPDHPLVSAAALNRKACSEKRVTVIRRRPSNGWLSAFPVPRANRTERYLCTRLEFTGAAADTIISITSSLPQASSVRRPCKVSKPVTGNPTRKKSSRGRILIAAVVEFGGRLWNRSPSLGTRARSVCSVYQHAMGGKVCRRRRRCAG